MRRNRCAILINPPLYDTQYWARWSMPHGLLKIASWLKNEGYDLHLFDCLNPYGQDSKIPGKPVDYESYDSVRKERKSVVNLASNVEVPVEELENGVHYKLKPYQKWKFSFGMPIGILEMRLDELKNNIRFMEYDSIEIWVTSIMTYWWEGTRDAIQLATKIFPEAKVRVGGIYPTLAPWHAETKLGLKTTVINGNLLDLENKNQMDQHLIVTGEVPAASDLGLLTELYDEKERPPYTILTTSRGCPHICAYCASNVLNGGTKVRNRGLEDVMTEIKEKFRNGTRVFCFYEDNLLMKMKEFKEILKSVLTDHSLRGIKLYAPEGIEIGVAMSDRKLYLLKLKSDKRILATFSINTEEKGIAEYFNKDPEKKLLLYSSLEEDLTNGAVLIKKQDDEFMELEVAGQDNVVLRKVYKQNGRHELIYENEEDSSLGLYLVGVPEVIYLMKLCGFDRIYLPLETIKKETNARWNRAWNSNINRFEDLLNALIEVGYNPRKQNINAFVMFGLPGEDIEEIYDTALYASEKVGSVVPMLFTPVPSTGVYDQYRDYIEQNNLDLQHLNGKLFPFFPLLKENFEKVHPDMTLELSDYLRLESFMQRLNTKISGEAVNIYTDSKVANTFRKVFGEYQPVL
jgi:hypothetical protein